MITHCPKPLKIIVNNMVILFKCLCTGCIPPFFFILLHSNEISVSLIVLILKLLHNRFVLNLIKKIWLLLLIRNKDKEIFVGNKLVCRMPKEASKCPQTDEDLCSA